jgi:hypothetical protein
VAGQHYERPRVACRRFDRVVLGCTVEHHGFGTPRVRD